MQIIEKDISWLVERVPDFMKFYEAHKIMFEGGYIAGGFARAMVLKGSALEAMPKETSAVKSAGDIDFFYTTSIFCNNAITKLNKIIYRDKGVPRYVSGESLTGFAQDLYDRENYVKYQVIIKSTGSPSEVLNRFDISNCKIATDGKKVWMVEDWEELEKNKHIRIDNYAGRYLLSRIKKYIFRNKGYSLWDGNREELLSTLLKLAPQSPQGVRSVLNVIKESFTKEKITIFYGMLGEIDASEKDGNYEYGSLNVREDFALHMYKRMAEKEMHA